MKVSLAHTKICPFMSLPIVEQFDNDNYCLCVTQYCMSWVFTKEYIAIPSGSAFYDDIGDELPSVDKEGYCILLERQNDF